MAHTVEEGYPFYASKQELMERLRAAVYSGTPMTYDDIRNFSNTDTDQWGDATYVSSDSDD